MSMPTMLNIFALVFFALGLIILLRVRKAETADKAKYLRAATGAMAVAAGNATVTKQPIMGFLFYLMGAVLILTGQGKIKL